MHAWCNWQVKLCDPCLSALNRGSYDDALYKSTHTLLYYFTVRGPTRIPAGAAVKYVLYTAELGRIVELYDDSHVYTSINVGNTTAAVQTFTACIVDMKAWMSASGLRLNPAKTQVMWLGSS